MPTARQRSTHETWLLELTAIPTAAGREDRVVRWVRQWVKRRATLAMRRDRAGNVLITQRRRSARRPLYLTAHLDHPAFVVRRLLDERLVELEFRGGVHDPYFEGAAIEIFDRDDRRHRGRIRRLDPSALPFKRVIVETVGRTGGLAPGDIGRWAAAAARGGASVLRDGLLHAPACDDLAGAAAALAALDVLRRRRGAGHVGVLLTLAEEVGFIGATAACRLRTVPRRARLICLENSRSFADSPIGGGPIVRVGDKLSVFSPQLTNQVTALVTARRQADPSFGFQRRLMPGGSCEATTFSSFGYEATCVCLPLGNYHNMRRIDEVLAGRRPARVGPEQVAVSDFHGMVELLVICGEHLDDREASPLRERMKMLYERNGHVLEESDKATKRPSD